MNILVSSWGSTGDVLPPIAIGWELKRRGHRVTFAGNPYFTRLVHDAGLEMLPVGSVADHEKLMADSELFDSVKRSRESVFAEHYYPQMPAYYRAAEQVAAAGPTILVGGEIGSVTAAERLGLPWVLVACSPGSNTIITSKRDPLHPQRMLPNWARWFARSGMRMSMLYRLKMARHGRFRWPKPAESHLIEDKPISDFRIGLGMPGRLRFKPQMSLCMWPDWFAEPQPDWPEGSHIAGFPMYPRPRAPSAPDGPAVADKPVVITSGSIAGSQIAFYSRAVDACSQLGLGALLVTAHAESIPARLPANIRHVGYAPFHELIGRTSLVIHHGGIGTAAYALAAGVPQIVMPMRGDQFDNGNRLERLGVGRVLSGKDTSARQLAHVMETMVHSRDVARRCRHWQARTVPEEGLRRAADIIERLDGAASCREENP